METNYFYRKNIHNEYSFCFWEIFKIKEKIKRQYLTEK
nr:MAG TPA: IFab alpha, beta [Caudoviricetes sp.]